MIILGGELGGNLKQQAGGRYVCEMTWAGYVNNRIDQIMPFRIVASGMFLSGIFLTGRAYYRCCLLRERPRVA
jgi:hypothetical protein